MSEKTNKYFSINEKSVAVLIDPDKSTDPNVLKSVIEKAEFAKVKYFFVGGSTVSREDFNKVVSFLKNNTSIPVIIFPGASHQISPEADALLYLSLISGRNPDYLIGHHVASAHEVYDMDLLTIPTAYILIEGGTHSSVAYVSQTTPIPSDKTSIITNTAKAGILQGKQLLYLDAGSGAIHPVPTEVIEVLKPLKKPIIIGGGVTSTEKIKEMHNAGANVVVIGNKIEDDINFLLDIQLYNKERL